MMREPAPARSPVAAPTLQEPPLKFRSARHTAVVKEVFDITPKYPETYLIRFTFENEPVFDFQPGQFISLFAEKDGKAISRPYSIASAPETKQHLELAIKVVEGGFMSNYLHTVPAGTRLKSIGPLGRFIMPEPVQNDVVFVATGTGVAPFLSMIGHMYSMRYDVGIEVVFGVRYVYDLIYRKELEAWERTHKNFRFYPTVSRPETPEWRGRVGYVQKILQNEIQHKGRKDVYICGLHDMVEQVTQLCREEGFRTVRFEKWD